MGGEGTELLFLTGALFAGVLLADAAGTVAAAGVGAAAGALVGVGACWTCSKVSSLVILYCTLSIELAFENFYFDIWRPI